MKLIIIFGPQAVGKMTVGQELEKITGLKLFHNHMTIDLVSPFFNYGTLIGKKLVKLFRRKIFEEVAKSDLEGLIFTYLWALNKQKDIDYINTVCRIFESKGATVYFVELEAPIQLRLERNKHPHRLHHKPTKRDITHSERDLLESMKKYRFNSKNGEIQRKNYIKINNTTISPEIVAQQVKKTFSL